MAQPTSGVSDRDHFQTIVNEFARETDRASVILGAARIDELLHQALAAVLLPCPTGSDPLLDSERPLSTFSAKIDAAYRLGLIDAEFSWALHIVRKLRNDMAHGSAGVRLDESPHKDRITQLAAVFRERESFKQLRAILGAWQATKTQAALDLLTVLGMGIAALGWLAQNCKRLSPATAPQSIASVTFTSGAS